MSEPMCGRKIRVLLVDDHVILRVVLSQLLRTEPDIDVVGGASDGRQAVEMARALRPDVVIMDLSLPVMNGIEATGLIKAEMPDVRVIGLSMYNKEEMGEAVLAAGAVVYLSKGAPAEELLNAIRANGPSARDEK